MPKKPAVVAKPTNTAHTAGPWKAVLGRPDYREMTTIVQDRKGPNGEDPMLLGYVLREWVNPHQQRQDDANARLMASAPELLAALEAILAWADRECLPQGGKNDGPWQLAESAVKNAKGAMS